MRNKRFNRELTTVGIIFAFICLGLQIGEERHKQTLLNKDLLIAKTVAVELYDEVITYDKMVQSMNNYADELEATIQQADELHKMRKDLDKVPRGLKKLTIATCYDETGMKYNAVHTGPGNDGVEGICGIHKNWIGKIPGLTKDNINTLYAGSLVLNYYLKNSSNEFEALKGYKGSINNLKPVYNTLNFKSVVNLYVL